MNGLKDKFLQKSPIIKARPLGRNRRGGAARSGRGNASKGRRVCRHAFQALMTRRWPRNYNYSFASLFETGEATECYLDVNLIRAFKTFFFYFFYLSYKFFLSNSKIRFVKLQT